MAPWWRLGTTIMGPHIVSKFCILKVSKKQKDLWSILENISEEWKECCLLLKCSYAIKVFNLWISCVEFFPNQKIFLNYNRKWKRWEKDWSFLCTVQLKFQMARRYNCWNKKNWKSDQFLWVWCGGSSPLG